MMAWLTILKTIGSWIFGVSFIAFLAWLGWSNLYRLHTTGELLAEFGGKGGTPKYSKLITLESDPFNFVGLFVVDVLLATVGTAFFVALLLRIRKWWINKPKPTAE